MSPIPSEILLFGYIVGSSFRRTTHLVHSFSVIFLYFIYNVALGFRKLNASDLLSNPGHRGRFLVLLTLDRCCRRRCGDVGPARSVRQALRCFGLESN